MVIREGDPGPKIDSNIIMSLYGEAQKKLSELIPSNVTADDILNVLHSYSETYSVEGEPYPK